MVPPNTALLKLAFYFSLALVLGCVPLFIEGRVDPLSVGLCCGVFVVLGTVAGVSLLPGASELRLSPQGFVSSRLFVRRQYRWSDISEFRVAGGGGGPPRAGFDFAPSFPHRRLARVYSRIAYGVDETLAAYVGLPPTN